MNRWQLVVNFVVKVIVVFAFFTAWWMIYSCLNTYGSHSERAAEFTRPTDSMPNVIQPWTAVIYLVGGLVMPLLPFFWYRTGRRIGFALACYATASIIAFACYGACPVKINRPSYEGAEIGQWLMRKVSAIDGAANCTPSSHVYFAVLGALLVDRVSPSIAVRVFVWGLAAVVSVTTVTTGQHYWVDIPAGAITALVAFAVVNSLFRRETRCGDNKSARTQLESRLVV